MVYVLTFCFSVREWNTQQWRGFFEIREMPKYIIVFERSKDTDLELEIYLLL